ncbi:cytosolic sulfotransferase 14-like [Prosopis cineraria]|uniref:cytosolic sulfotransferase 14-like n=1 Tax=Prosopis cineraria TaxID=364024 RepID=UPI00240F4C6D|nr:cytosolic sulfotransferase 14-like [Prosopis cineraria]
MAPKAPIHFTKPRSSNCDRHREEEELEAIVEGEEKLSQECKDLILSLPRERGWRTRYLYLFQGFWCQPAEIQAITLLQNHFQATDSDVVVATIPKSGTTWLKGLTFATVNRKSFSPSSKNHPLLHSNPHHLVPFFEYTVYGGLDEAPDLSSLPDPRLFGTHLPFHAMPSSIKNSGCKIIYLCRNPFDTFVSSWIFVDKIKPGSIPSLTLEEAFDLYCKGIIGFGPSWDHMLRYWNESKERPNKVLFLKYEDLKEDTTDQLKRIAEFLGCPFSLEEEDEETGVIDSIIKLCSFEKMKELQVNKSGTFARNFENKHLFRKAEIGDWLNHLSPSMVERLSKLIDEKLAGSGLSFKIS